MRRAHESTASHSPSATRLPALIGLIALAALIASTVARSASQQPAAAPAPAAAQAQAADPALFDPIASVVTHPRCLNCHQEDFPRQTDARIRHTQMVVRGKDGHGAPTLQCQSCHQAANSADGKVPGVATWHLAPLSMKWEGLSKTQICEQLKDPRRNGNRRTAHEVIEHMRVDPLVIWAWNPGAGRSTPVISHERFVKALEVWADAGMPCPKDAPSFASR